MTHESPAETRPPLHGFRGDAPADDGPAAHPRGLTVALSREAGARGSVIARKLGEILGWQVFDQELLDYLLLDDTGRGQLAADIPPAAREWADRHLARLQREGRVNADPDTVAQFRLLLAVAARGDAVIVGRAAGYLLPAESTLHVRVVAPFDARVHYLAETLRLTPDEAADEARRRDDRRARFLTRTLASVPPDLAAYDLAVNSTRLGVEAAAQFIAWALRSKQQFSGPSDAPRAADFEDAAGS